MKFEFDYIKFGIKNFTVKFYCNLIRFDRYYLLQIQ